MLKIVKERTFKHTIKVRVPIDGGYKDETFKATYRLLEAEEVASFDLFKPAQVKAFLARAVVRLDELIDEANNPLEHSDELLDSVTSVPLFSNPLAKGYFDAVSGAREKN